MGNPNTAVFPGAIPDYNVLPVANDTFFTTLSSGINNSQTSGISLGFGGFNVPCLLVVDDEIILAQTLSGSTVTASVRGFGGTTAVSHSSGTGVFGYICAYHHNQILAELVAVCTALGVSLANIISSGQSASGDLSGTYPGPTVASVGGFSAGTITNAITKALLRVTINPVTFSATPTFNFNLGYIQKIVLTGNVTSSTVSNIVAGELYTFHIIQDSGGAHTFVWDPNVKGAMTVDGTGNIDNIQQFMSTDGTTLYAVSLGVAS